MEKEALLRIVLRDIKELELLITTFIGEDYTSDGYIQLAKNKTQSILDELELISQSKEDIHVQPVEQPVAKKNEENTITPKKEEVKEVVQETIEKPDEKPVVIEEQKTTPPIASKETSKEPPAKLEVKSPSKSVIGEVLGKDNKSLNEQLSKNNSPSESSFQGAISDLKKAIGINDRFLFQRELFNSNSEVYNQVIDQINEMHNYESAIAFIKGNFNWNTEDEATITFLELVKRRFKTK